MSFAAHRLRGAMRKSLLSCSILSGWMSFAARIEQDLPRASYAPCSILSGWMSFAAQGRQRHAERYRHLQYPQRMDELCSHQVMEHTGAIQATCSILSGWMSFAACAWQSHQYTPKPTCSILSGWMSFAAKCGGTNGIINTALQYPQRMDELCS